MKKSTTVLLLISLLSTISFGQTAQEIDALPLLENWMEENIKKHHLAGGVIAVAIGDEAVYTKAWGMNDVESKQPMKEEDLFSIASMSKVVTTVAVLQLYEKGLFDLDDPASKFIPELANLSMLDGFNASDSSYTTVPLKEPITIRHLLNHTSGIAYAGQQISKIHEKSGFNRINAYNGTLKEFISALSQIPLKHQPGEGWTYGHSTDVLGHLIEELSGKTLPEYLEDNIFIPLNMTSTGFNIESAEYERYASLYREKNGELLLIQNPEQHISKGKPVTLFYAGSGLVSSAPDFIKFTQMLLNEGEHMDQRILKKESVKLMASPQIGSLTYPKMFYPLLGEHNTFGFGVNVVSGLGSTDVSYSQGSYFWEGRFATSFIIDPVSNISAVFMTQVGTRYPLRQEFRNLVVKSVKEHLNTN